MCQFTMDCYDLNAAIVFLKQSFFLLRVGMATGKKAELFLLFFFSSLFLFFFFYFYFESEIFFSFPCGMATTA